MGDQVHERASMLMDVCLSISKWGDKLWHYRSQPWNGTQEDISRRSAICIYPISCDAIDATGAAGDTVGAAFIRR